jgi:hypothetical protein
VGDAADADDFAIVVDYVRHAVIPDSDAPDIFLATQFSAAGWSWIGSQPVDLRHQPRNEGIA